MTETKLNKLLGVLRVIAAPADKQLESLTEWGHFEDHDIDNIDGSWNIDEIGLQFDDVDILIPAMLERGEIDEGQAQCLAQLGVKLTHHSGAENYSLWTVKALRTAPEWDDIRELAQACLDKIENVH